MNDVGPSLVEDSLLLPVEITARWSKKLLVGVRSGSVEVPLNSKVDTSLTQRVFQVLDIIGLVLIPGSGCLRARPSSRGRCLRGG